MGIRLKRNIWKFLFLLLLFFNCKTTKEINERYLSEFKNMYFIECIQHGFNNNKEINFLLKQDKSLNSDFILGIKTYNLIRKLAKKTAKEIYFDSIKSMKYAHKSNKGKKVISKCLYVYKSKYLDSIAKRQFKK